MAAAVPESFGGRVMAGRMPFWARLRPPAPPGTLLTAARQAPVPLRDVAGDPVICHRLLELGFTPGETVSVLAVAPLGGPLAVAVRGTIVALRRSEAACLLT